MKKVEFRLGDKIVAGTPADFETLREQYNSYKLVDGSTIRMKTVFTNIIRTEEFTPGGEPVYIVNSQNVLVAHVPDELKKPRRGPVTIWPVPSDWVIDIAPRRG